MSESDGQGWIPDLVQRVMEDAQKQAQSIGSGYNARYVGLKRAEDGTITAEFELEIPHG